MRVDVIVPKGRLFDTERFKYANRTSSITVAKKAKSDFELSVKNWERKPVFRIIDDVASDFFEIGTDDELYGMINDGVDPHVIMPVRAKVLVFNKGYKAKTTPGFLMNSTGGRFGNVVRTNFVWHPGIEPRNFQQVVAERTDAMFVRLKINDIIECNR